MVLPDRNAELLICLTQGFDRHQQQVVNRLLPGHRLGVRGGARPSARENRPGPHVTDPSSRRREKAASRGAIRVILFPIL